MPRRRILKKPDKKYGGRNPEFFEDDDFDDFDDDLDDGYDDDFDDGDGFADDGFTDDAFADGSYGDDLSAGGAAYDDYDDDDFDPFDDEEAPAPAAAARRAGRGRKRAPRPRRTEKRVRAAGPSGDRKRQIGGILFYVIPVILLAVIVVSGYFFLSDLLSYKKAGDEYRALEKFIVVKKEPRVEVPVEEDTEEEDSFPNMDIDYDALAEKNSDFVGVLYIPSLELTYPVVLSHDNDEYLDRTFEGTNNPSGSIFMDCYANPALTDSNTLIYGHNMKNETMFGSLKRYLTARGFEAYKEDPYFYIYTKERVFKYEIFSFHTTPVDGYVYDGFSGESGYDSYVRKAQADFDVTLESLDEERLHEYDFSERPDMVTLSTCFGSGHTHNFVIHGMLAHKFIF